MNIAENLQAITNNVPLVYQTGCEENIDAFINKLQQIAPNAVMLDLNNLEVSNPNSSSPFLARTCGASNNIKVTASPNIVQYMEWSYAEDPSGMHDSYWGMCSKYNHDCYWYIEPQYDDEGRPLDSLVLATCIYKTLDSNNHLIREVSGKINIGFGENILSNNHSKFMISFKYYGALSIARYILYDANTNKAAVHTNRESNWLETNLKNGWKHVLITGDFSNYLAAGITDNAIKDTTLRLECAGYLAIKDFCVISLKN